MGDTSNESFRLRGMLKLVLVRAMVFKEISVFDKILIFCHDATFNVEYNKFNGAGVATDRGTCARWQCSNVWPP